MNIINLARRADAVVGLLLVAFALYSLMSGSYLWGALALISAVVSFASAKYVPARWLAKRMMLARLKVNG